MEVPHHETHEIHEKKTGQLWCVFFSWWWDCLFLGAKGDTPNQLFRGRVAGIFSRRGYRPIPPPPEASPPATARPIHEERLLSHTSVDLPACRTVRLGRRPERFSQRGRFPGCLRRPAASRFRSADRMSPATARYASSDAAVVRIDDARLSSAGRRWDGASASLTAPPKRASRCASRGVGGGRAIDFKTEIVPLLSRLGCNAGGCHGKASGQNGFKLSLFGFDAGFDYDAIAQGGARPAHLPRGSRRTACCCSRRPARCRTAAASASTRQRGISAGAAAGSRPARRLGARCAAASCGCASRPADRILRPGQVQQLAVVAEYSDGSRPRRDPPGGILQQSRCRRHRGSRRPGAKHGSRAARRRSWPATWATSPSSAPWCRTASR